MKKSFLFLLILPLFYGCPAYDPPMGGIKISNNSNSVIYVYKACSDSFKLDDELKLFKEMAEKAYDSKGNEILSIASPSNRIDSFSHNIIITGGRQKKPSINCKDKTIRLFIIKENTIQTKTWREITENQLYELKIVKTEDELNDENWEVIYKDN